MQNRHKNGCKNVIFGRNAVILRGYIWRANPRRLCNLICSEPWFVAADVCRALDVVNSRDAVARLDADEKNTVVLTDGTPGNPQKTIVNEPGLYTLVLGSSKPI